MCAYRRKKDLQGTLLSDLKRREMSHHEKEGKKNNNIIIIITKWLELGRR